MAVANQDPGRDPDFRGYILREAYVTPGGVTDRCLGQIRAWQ